MANEKNTGRRAAKWRGYAINVLIIVVVVAGVRAWQQRDMAGGMAPPLRGDTIAGRNLRLPAHPERPVLVHFWATWCPVCRAEQGSIAAIAQDDVEVITIAMQSGKSEAVSRYMREQEIDFPVVNDPDARISAEWGVHAVPASFIVAPDGQIRFIEVGYTTEIGLRLRLWLAGL